MEIGSLSQLQESHSIVGQSWASVNASSAALLPVLTSTAHVRVYHASERRCVMSWSLDAGTGTCFTAPAILHARSRQFMAVVDGSKVLAWDERHSTLRDASTLDVTTPVSSVLCPSTTERCPVVLLHRDGSTSLVAARQRGAAGAPLRVTQAGVGGTPGSRVVWSRLVSLKGRAAGQHVLLVVVQPTAVPKGPKPRKTRKTRSSSRGRGSKGSDTGSATDGDDEGEGDQEHRGAGPELLVYDVQPQESAAAGGEVGSASISLSLRHALQPMAAEASSGSGAAADNRVLAGCFHKQMLCLSLFWGSGLWTQHRFRLMPGWYSHAPSVGVVGKLPRLQAAERGDAEVVGEGRGGAAAFSLEPRTLLLAHVGADGKGTELGVWDAERGVLLGSTSWKQEGEGDGTGDASKGKSEGAPTGSLHALQVGASQQGPNGCHVCLCVGNQVAVAQALPRIPTLADAVGSAGARTSRRLRPVLGAGPLAAIAAPSIGTSVVVPVAGALAAAALAPSHDAASVAARAGLEEAAAAARARVLAASEVSRTALEKAGAAARSGAVGGSLVTPLKAATQALQALVEPAAAEDAAADEQSNSKGKGSGKAGGRGRRRSRSDSASSAESTAGSEAVSPASSCALAQAGSADRVAAARAVTRVLDAVGAAAAMEAGAPSPTVPCLRACVNAVRAAARVAASGCLSDGEARRGGMLAAVARMPAGLWSAGAEEGQKGGDLRAQLACAWVECACGVLEGVRDVSESAVVRCVAVVLALAGAELAGAEVGTKRGSGAQAGMEDGDEDDEDEDESEEDSDSDSDEEDAAGAGLIGGSNPRTRTRGMDLQARLASSTHRLLPVDTATRGPLELFCKMQCTARGVPEDDIPVGREAVRRAVEHAVGLAVSLERNDLLLHAALAGTGLPDPLAVGLAGVLTRLVKVARASGSPAAGSGADGSSAAACLLREAAAPGKRTAGERRDRRSGAVQGALRALSATEGQVLVGAAAHRSAGGLLRWGDAAAALGVVKQAARSGAGRGEGKEDEEAGHSGASAGTRARVGPWGLPSKGAPGLGRALDWARGLVDARLAQWALAMQAVPEGERERVQRLGSGYGGGRAARLAASELAGAARMRPPTAILALLHAMDKATGELTDECAAMRDLKGPLAHLLQGVGLPVAPPQPVEQFTLGM